jgi:hypothetical protein
MAVEKHFSHPFRRNANGSVVVDVQDSAAHITSCELRIVACSTGQRAARPEFGWAFGVFRPGPVSLDSLTLALNMFEPRGDATGQDYSSAADAAVGSATLQINVGVPNASTS